MSTKVIQVQDQQLVKGFNTANDVNWCSPTVVGCNICVSASANNGMVTINASINTPLGSYSQSFSFDTNTCFNWSPIDDVTVSFCVSNLSIQSTQICFTLSAQICVDPPIFPTFCTPTFSYGFCVPLPGNSLGEKLAAKKITQEQLIQALIFRHLLDGKNDQHCDCKK